MGKKRQATSATSASAPKGKPRRPRGRPKKGTEPIPPDRYEELVSLRCQGYSHQQLAAHFGVERNTIQNRLDRIMPMMRQSPYDTTLDYYCQAIREIWKTCWERFRSNAPFETVEKVRDSLTGDGSKNDNNKKIVEKLLQRKYKEGQIGWMQLALECIVQESKMRGVSEDVSRLEVSHVLRYAGMSPDEIDDQVIARIESAIVDTQDYCHLLTDAG